MRTRVRKVRAAALRGLRTLDVIPTQHVVPLLRDPSAKVIREASAALRARSQQLPEGLAADLLGDADRAVVRRAGYRLYQGPDLVQRLRTALVLASDPDRRLSAQAGADAAALIRSIHPTSWRTRPVPAFEPTPEQGCELLDLAHAADTALPHRTLQLLHERLDPFSTAAELLRGCYGPHPDTTNPLMELEATFTAHDSYAAVTLIKEVLLAVLPHAARPAEDWPADERWPEILPDWFVQRCAPEATEQQGTPEGWISWWRGLTQCQRDLELQTDAIADWRLSDWINFFDPDGMAGSRSWRAGGTPAPGDAPPPGSASALTDTPTEADES